MKKRRLLSMVLCIALVLSAVFTTAFAVTFDDVENDPTVSWAEDAITEMADAGYIKGYEDGTFKPKRPISKIECLLLMSRILGVEEKEYAEVAESAEALYGGKVSKYNTTYVNELSYLRYAGIIDDKDLSDYASSANANTELYRYQAAILMAKLMGEPTVAKNYSVTTPTYADNSAIPSTARPYVEYVTAKGIMNGMDADSEGNPMFSPATSVTRAQMATLLQRMIDKIDKDLIEGAVEEVMAADNIIVVDGKEYTVNADTVTYYDGDEIGVEDLIADDNIRAIEINKHLHYIEVLEATEEEPEEKPEDEPEENDVTIVYALISAMSENAKGKTLVLADTEDSSNTASYLTTTDCKFSIEGTKCNFGDLKKGNYVEVAIEDGKITSVNVAPKETIISGTMTKDVEFDDDNHVYLTVDTEDDGVQTYVVSNKGATVTRDGANVEYRNLSKGDSVDLKLNLGKVTKITASSNSEKFSGIIKEIIISSKPAVTVSIKGEEETYELRSDATIQVAGQAATIYDLRLNVNVTGTIDGDEIATLIASTSTASQAGEISGTVTGVNTSYKVITIEDNDGETQNIYYGSNTTFLKNNGNTTSAKNIEKGATVLVTGAEKNGVFEASIVIVK